MSRLTIIFVLIILCVSILGCANQVPTASSKEQNDDKVEILIAAAASLTDALMEMKAAFEYEHPGITATYHFASSGKLAKQIGLGAPSDLFLSASEKDMDFLEENNLILKDSRINFSQNRLVLITQKERPIRDFSFEIIFDSYQHLAIGNPDSVPAGRYAKQTLESIQQWNRSQGKLVLGSDVRQVLTYVESGNVEFGIVYYSDALGSDKVKVVAEAKSEWHHPIVYPAAILTQSSHQEEAGEFLRFLNSKKGKEILKKYGFK